MELINETVPIVLSSSFDIVTSCPSAMLASSMEEYKRYILDSTIEPLAKSILSPTTATAVLSRVQIMIDAESDVSADEFPDPFTNYNYSLTVKSFPNNQTASAIIHAESIHGARYGLESFSQLVFLDEHRRRVLSHGQVNIQDTPQFRWRGLMVDPGRRFFPLPLLKNLLDTMSYAKLNVLHLHASDYCRWSVESMAYPSLMVNQGAASGDGYYTHADIHDLVQYAAQRGIRVVPEFDLPGHSRGLIPLENITSIQFCQANQAWRNQLRYDHYNTSNPSGTLGVLQGLLAEMSSLFPDPVFHIGSDETGVTPDCPANATMALELALIRYVYESLNKVPMGWQNNIQAAAESSRPPLKVQQRPILNAYIGSDSASQGVEAGFDTVDSNSAAWYATHPAGWDENQAKCEHGCPGVSGYGMSWYRPGGKENNTGSGAKVLGGELSMWSDDYVSLPPHYHLCHLR